MKKIILSMVLVFSSSAFAHDNHQICGIKNISAENIHIAAPKARVADAVVDYRMDGATVVVCDYLDGQAVVGVYPDKQYSVLIFGK